MLEIARPAGENEDNEDEEIMEMEEDVIMEDNVLMEEYVKMEDAEIENVDELQNSTTHVVIDVFY